MAELVSSPIFVPPRNLSEKKKKIRIRRIVSFYIYIVLDWWKCKCADFYESETQINLLLLLLLLLFTYIK